MHQEQPTAEPSIMWNDPFANKLALSRQSCLNMKLISCFWRAWAFSPIACEGRRHRIILCEWKWRRCQHSSIQRVYSLWIGPSFKFQPCDQRQQTKRGCQPKTPNCQSERSAHKADGHFDFQETELWWVRLMQSEWWSCVELKSPGNRNLILIRGSLVLQAVCRASNPVFSYPIAFAFRTLCLQVAVGDIHNKAESRYDNHRMWADIRWIVKE